MNMYNLMSYVRKFLHSGMVYQCNGSSNIGSWCPCNSNYTCTSIRLTLIGKGLHLNTAQRYTRQHLPFGSHNIFPYVQTDIYKYKNLIMYHLCMLSHFYTCYSHNWVLFVGCIVVRSSFFGICMCIYQECSINLYKTHHWLKY